MAIKIIQQILKICNEYKAVGLKYVHIPNKFIAEGLIPLYSIEKLLNSSFKFCSNYLLNRNQTNFFAPFYRAINLYLL